MTEAGQSTTPSADTLVRPRLRKRGIGLIAVLILALIVAGVFFCPWVLNMRGGLLPNVSQTDQRFAEIGHQIQSINNRLDDIDIRVGKETADVSVSKGQESPASIETLAHIQGDLTSLSSAVAGLQAEVKQAGSSVAATQQAAENSLAEGIAFIQLRTAAGAGMAFAAELTALRRAMPDDGRFRDIIENLKPYADKGAPAIAALREEFMGLEPATSAAIDRSAAQNWRQRILAELKGLVSIRPLHGGDATDAVAGVENALADGNVDEAIVAVKTLPPDAQDVLKDWVVKAQARATVDTALHEISDRLITSGNPSSTSNPRNEP